MPKVPKTRPGARHSRRCVRRWLLWLCTAALWASVFVPAGTAGPPRAWAAGCELVWETRGGDPGHSGQTAAPCPAEAGVAWQALTYRAVRSNPVIAADGRIYIADNAGAACFSPDGEQLWQTSLGWCRDGGLAAGPGPDGELQLYFGSHDPWVFWCLGAADGRVRWQVFVPAAADGPPVVDHQGNVWFGCDDGVLRCYTPAGSLCRSIAMGSAVRSAPAVGPGGEVYAVSFGGRIVALAPDGSLRWQRELGCTTSSAPALRQGRLYVGDALGRAWCLDEHGEVVFSVQLQGPLGQPAVSGQGDSFFGSLGGTLYALTPAGEVAWTHRASGLIRAYGGPLVDQGGRVCFGAADGRLRLLAPDGSLIWQLALAGEPGALAATADGAVVAGTSQGRMLKTLPGAYGGPPPDPDPVWPPQVIVPEPAGSDGWHTARPEITVNPFPDGVWPQGTCLCWSAGAGGTESGSACGGPAVITPEAEGEYDLRLWLEREGEVIHGPAILALRVDTQPPLVEVLSPGEGAAVEAGRPLVPEIRATDTASGVASLALLLDGQGLDPDAGLAPGRHVLTITCRDHAGLTTEVSVEFFAFEQGCSAVALNPVLVARRGNGNRSTWDQWVTVLVRVPADIVAEGFPEAVLLGGVPGTAVAKLPAQAAAGQRLFLLRFDRQAVDTVIAGTERTPVGAGGRVFRVALDLSWWCGPVPCSASVSFMCLP